MATSLLRSGLPWHLNFHSLQTRPNLCSLNSLNFSGLAVRIEQIDGAVMEPTLERTLNNASAGRQSFDQLSNINEKALLNGSDSSQKIATPLEDVGAFKQLPRVTPSIELLGSALRRARAIRPTKGIVNIAKRERNRGAKQLDALTKELSQPLRGYVEGFPQRHRLHPYENCLIELTFGTGKYEEVLEKVNLLRKRILNVGKNCTSLCAKSMSKQEAEERLKEGISKLEELLKKDGQIIDELLNVAKTLRGMPDVDLKIPTLCLVGAPNVGKSSLVRVLSTGKPEVCNYPFTTRGISMGHIFFDCQRYQVTDTPGLLERPDEKRNNMEKLTLAAITHLPTAILYVHDLTGDCGSSVKDQLKIYKGIKERFSDRPWLDAVSKADLLTSMPDDLDSTSDPEALYRYIGPIGAIPVSIMTGQGLDELKQKVNTLLKEHLSEEKRDADISGYW